MLKKATFDDFPRLYPLLESGFPLDEYRPYKDQRELLNHPNYSAYVNEALTALITVWQFEDFAFIEHFVVDAACRNQGLGSKMLQWVVHMLSCPVCLEAEPPTTELAQRRLAFYKRNGFFVNEYPYEQPPYCADRCPVPLLILTTGGTVSEEQFAAIRDILYKEVYHA